MVKFMQAVHLARADVGGWSMGGWVSMKLALDHPEMVDRLIVYDSAGIYFPATFGPELFTPNGCGGRAEADDDADAEAADVPDFAAEAMVRKLQANAWVLQRSMAAMMSGRDLLDFRLHNIQEPTLIVWGAQDALIPLSVGETMHQSIPHSVLDVVEGCGHLAPAGVLEAGDRGYGGISAGRSRRCRAGRRTFPSQMSRARRSFNESKWT